ncbi:MAG: radical SAM protein [Gammaproteobacteria bacterium]|nr:radical SAM protein [Gammaproteobacteria bacterium]
MMKTLIITTPLRPVPTTYPPMGSLSIINYLRKHGGGEVEFYNIDANRPSYEEALRHIIDAKPDVLGVSAVVSTAYAYTKKITLDVKKACPDTLIVVGGNLAASAEILLRRTGTDVCVIGEGELTFLKIVKRAKSTKHLKEYSDIPNLAYIDNKDVIINTGYETPLEKTEIYDINWRDLEASTDISNFIFDPYTGDQALPWLDHDPRAREPHRRGKKLVELHAAKGCVARCTFCHRFDKGIRYIPVEVLRHRIQGLVDEYDVGFIVIADENFGTDRKWLRAFCEMIRPFDVLWRVAGMRVNCITPEFINLMKDAGCVSIIYGMETGSPKMLEVMEKKTKVSENCEAMKWTLGSDLYSAVQLVLGMPGETNKTVQETIEMCKYVLTLREDLNPNNLSINYAQALPGTPLYEFARHKGVIGGDQNGEEDYLLQISDRNAHDEFATLNFTELPNLVCQTWRPRVTIETNYAFVKKYGIESYRKVLLADANFFRKKRNTDGRFANPRRLIDMSITSDRVHDIKQTLELEEPKFPPLTSLLRTGNFGMAMICYPVLFFRLRGLLIFLVLAKNFYQFPLKYNMRIFWEYLKHGFSLFRVRRLALREYKTLRKIVWNDLGSRDDDNDALIALRKGR